MRDNAIYFPYIKVPKSTWFTHVLLYWNKIYSIIPDSTENYYTDAYRRKLVENDLVNAADPEFYLNNYLNYDSFKPFIDYISNPNYPIQRHRNDLRKRRWNDTILIRKVKFHYQVLHELLDTGLFKLANDNWIKVELYTAKQYMLFLAGLLSSLPQFNATAITDTSMELEKFNQSYQDDFKHQESANTNNLRGVTRSILLKEVLPTPSKDMNPLKIVKFKEKYPDELINFRRGLEEEIINISNINDPRSREDRKNIALDKAKSQMDDIIEKMKANGWTKIIKNNLKSLGVSIAPPVVAASYGALTHGTVTQETVLPTTIISSIILATNISNMRTEKIRNRKNVLKNNFYAYAVLARKELK